MSPEHKRLTHALLLSLLIHTSLLGLTFNGQGFWLPGFGFPWQDRRIEAPDLRVLVVPPPVTAAEPAVTLVAEPLGQTWLEQPVASGPASTPFVYLAPIPRRTTAMVASEAIPQAVANPGTDAATGAAFAPMPLRADRSGDTAHPPAPAPAVIAVARTDAATWIVPITPAMPTPVIAAGSSASSTETAVPSLRDAGDTALARVDQEAGERAVERPMLDPSKQEEQRRAEQLEVARQDAFREETVRAEIARLEAERREAAQQAAVLQAAARQDAAREEAARAQNARLEAERQEAASQAADLQKAARAEAARAEAARAEAKQEAAARREAALRAIGRQLDEEAARREAAARLPPSSSSLRRYRLFGRTDSNAELILYAEAWSRKIELNMTFDMVREATKQPHTNPLVTVAIRSDGSVESVTFVQSSGVAALDEAIRRVVDSQRPYQAFPPGLAREFDVIEIRRTWYFDMAIRLY